MPATKITDLLPIPKGTREPHAYQIFGLEEGEQDREKIDKAVDKTVKHLKAAKEDTDAKLWSKAAKLAQEARAVLADSEKKAQLDARFGIITISDEPETPVAPPAPAAADPLAGVLPTADPLAAVLPAANPLAPVATPQPSAASSPSPVATPSLPVPMDESPVPEESFAASISPAVTIEKPSTRRRRRSTAGTVMFAIFSLGMLSLIGILSYFLFFSTGQVAITNTDGQISISTQPDIDNEGTDVQQPAQRDTTNRVKRPVDPVMGNLAGDVEPPPRTTGLTDDVPDRGGDESTSVDETAMTTAPDTTPEMTDPEMTDPEMTDPETVFDAPDPDNPDPNALTEEMVAAADKQIASVRGLIRSANWKQMKAAAEALSEMRMSEEQATRAEALYELADLASYYRGGIERAIADLEIGNDFEVTEDFRVIIVEKGDDLLVIRYNERNRSYTFDELPFSLAYKLGTFSMPDSPTVRAAKAAYQAVAPKATEAHRDEAIDWLLGIEGEVEGADPKRVAETIAALFGEEA